MVVGGRLSEMGTRTVRGLGRGSVVGVFPARGPRYAAELMLGAPGARADGHAM